MNPKEQPIDLPSGASWEVFVRQSAQALPYPSTPDVASAVLARIPTRGHKRPAAPRPLWAAVVALALLLGLWAVPPVRAAIREFLQIGAVRIWLAEPTPTFASPTTVPSDTAPGATPALSPLSPLNLSGRTTLAEAAARANFAIPLPTYPEELGSPDAVFYQDLNGPAVILLWMQPNAPDEVAYSLHILSSDAFVMKSNPPVVATATVNGRAAAWTNGPYVLSYGTGEDVAWQMQYLVSGRVLIWEVDGLTYRLEGDFTLDEAIHMAESLMTVE